MVFNPDPCLSSSGELGERLCLQGLPLPNQRPNPSRLPIKTTQSHLRRPYKTSYDRSRASTSLHPSFPISSLTSSRGKSTNPALQGFRTKMRHGSSTIWMMCVCIALHPLSAELLQVLDTIDSFSPAHQKCLRELQEICGARRKLPRSYIPRCMNDTPGHDNCGPGEIVWWDFYSTIRVGFRRMFPLDKVFSPEGTEVGYFPGVASFPCTIDQSNSSFAVLLGGNI